MFAPHHCKQNYASGSPAAQESCRGTQHAPRLNQKSRLFPPFFVNILCTIVSDHGASPEKECQAAERPMSTAAGQQAEAWNKNAPAATVCDSPVPKCFRQHVPVALQCLRKRSIAYPVLQHPAGRWCFFPSLPFRSEQGSSTTSTHQHPKCELLQGRAGCVAAALEFYLSCSLQRSLIITITSNHDGESRTHRQDLRQAASLRRRRCLCHRAGRPSARV